MSQKINHKLRNKEWRPARSDGGSTTQFRWLVINFLFKKNEKIQSKKYGGFKSEFLSAALAAGLVGLVTPPAAPTGHRPPALWQKARNLSIRNRKFLKFFMRKIIV